MSYADSIILEKWTQKIISKQVISRYNDFTIIIEVSAIKRRVYYGEYNIIPNDLFGDKHSNNKS